MPRNLQRFNNDWQNMIPYTLMFENRTEDKRGTASKVRDFYMDGEPMKWSNRKGWIQVGNWDIL